MLLMYALGYPTLANEPVWTWLQINFPRCYVLGFPDHYDIFLDDFRITACMGVLKWFTGRYESKLEVHSMDGTVPHSALNFAMDRYVCRMMVFSAKVHYFRLPFQSVLIMSKFRLASLCKKNHNFSNPILRKSRWQSALKDGNTVRRPVYRIQ